MHGIIAVQMPDTNLSPAECERLTEVVGRHMALCDGLRSHCDRCLQTRRWGGSVTLMVVDAAFMSIGLNYFTAVVPGVATYEQEMLAGRVPDSLGALSRVRYESVAEIWKNRRSWEVAKGVADCLSRYDTGLADGDAAALRAWAAQACLESWTSDAVGMVKGVGINTYQYLRMMGGIDTSMPDKIVRRVIAQMAAEAAVQLSTKGDLELVDTIALIGHVTGHRPVELCWMTWMVQSEGKMVRMDKYRDLLQRI
jgi:hypothetical protein